MRTVADGCDRERNVERTHPQPPDPQSETGTLATHSGKICRQETPNSVCVRIMHDNVEEDVVDDDDEEEEDNAANGDIEDDDA